MPDAGTGLLIVTVAAPTNAVVTGHPSSWSTAGIELQVSIHGGGQQGEGHGAGDVVIHPPPAPASAHFVPVRLQHRGRDATTHRDFVAVLSCPLTDRGVPRSVRVWRLRATPPLERRRRPPPVPLRRAALTKGARASRSLPAFSSDSSTSYTRRSRPKVTVSEASDPSRSSTSLTRTVRATVRVRSEKCPCHPRSWSSRQRPSQPSPTRLDSPAPWTSLPSPR